MGGVRRFKKRLPKKRQGLTGNDRKPYEEIKKENVAFEKYYKAQNIVPEDQWDEFLLAMKRDLPASFRISDCNPGEAEKLLSIVKGDFFSRLISSTEELKVPNPLPWYPKELGWQLEITRKDIRRSETYFKLHNFLMSETETGAISRQEAVSMIPPLVLGVEPHHKVLDMCAAPGSKTAQLIEALHRGHKVPAGIVVANDIDNSRCYMLVHQAKRLNSPCTIITNHDSSVMPNIIVRNEDGFEGVLKYDRVLCDVPCTGDGTLRKNPDIWPKWNPANGSNLHGVQYRILKRGVELLAIGGRAVYSTCSLNPVENEAVIHRLLSEAKGSLELMEMSHLLPGLKFSRGVSSWSPASKDVTLYTKFDQVDEKWHTQLRPTMFPPEDALPYNLEKCLRILPHHQDTGGFFLAAIVKKSKLPWESESGSQPDSDKISSPPKKKRKPQGYKEDPFVFFNPQEPIWESLKDFYKIDGLNPSQFLTRCTVGKKKNIYFVSELVRDILAKNQEIIKIINCGVKVFARCDNKSMDCCFRLAQEGLDRVESFFKPDRRIRVRKEDLIKLLLNADPSSPVEGSSLNLDIQQQLEKISQGSCILDYEEDLKLTLVGWRGRQTLRPYVSIADAVHFLHLVGGDPSKYSINKFKKEDSLEADKKYDKNSGSGSEEKRPETGSECQNESKMDSEAT